MDKETPVNTPAAKLLPDDRTDMKGPDGRKPGILILLHVILFQSLLCSAQPSLIPYPQKVTWSNERFILDGTEIDHDARVFLNIVDELPGVPVNENEAYCIKVTSDSVLITAITGEGFFRANSTLEQLIAGAGGVYYIPGCTISDYPAFSIRGFMHDAGRYFIPVSELKEQVGILSRFKINTFHWHLTEDIAWRLESDIFPALTDPSVTTRDTGYYTREEVIDFLDFCKQHFVSVIPEIDMPGHSGAFTRATGMSVQSPEGKALTKKLLAEACELFGTDYFHIGTDEVKITDPYFAGEMASVVRKSGKQVIGWWPGDDPGEDAVRQLWMGNEVPEPGRKVIDSRFLYLNHTDPFADLFAIYNSRICGSGIGTDLLLGGICCIWNDRAPSSVNDIILSNSFYPSMLAFSERSWKGGGCDIRECGVNMGNPVETNFEAFRDFEQRMLECRERILPDKPFPYLKQTDVRWRIAGPFPNEGDLTRSFPPEKVFAESYSWLDSVYVTGLASGASVYLRHTWGSMVPSYLTNPQPYNTVYAFTGIYSPVEQDAGLYLAFHNFGRSEKDATPPQGKWDYEESEAWLNSVPLEPPVLKNAGLVPADLETPYNDENFWLRPPLPVHLKQGWNTLLLKIPVGSFSTPYTRLVKWMFNAVIVSRDGRTTPDGLIYSPDAVLNPVQPTEHNY